MPFMEWNDTLSVDCASIDKKLGDSINRLHDAMMERLGASVVGGVLNDLKSISGSAHG